MVVKKKNCEEVRQKNFVKKFVRKIHQKFRQKIRQKYVHQKYVHQKYVHQNYVQQKYVQQKYVHQEFLSLDAELPKPTNLGSYKFRSFTCYACDRQA